MKYVDRDIVHTFDESRESHRIVAVVGPRQAGKTTFLQNSLPPHSNYVFFDDPDAKQLFEKDIKAFAANYVEGNDVTVLDEIQYCEDAGSKLKYLADVGHTLWITSSSETILKSEILSFLVGRVAICRLYPFSFAEYKRTKENLPTRKSVERAMYEHGTYGGYPNVVKQDSFDTKKNVLQNLYETMLLKDVAQSFSITAIDKLERVTAYLSHQVGSLLNYQKICSNLAISHKTLKKYLNALEQSYILKRIKPFYTNKQKELVKQAKIFFVDNGILNTARKSFSTTFDGASFENYVYTELLRNAYTPQHWRTKTKQEVDFIINSIPVEVKRTQSIKQVPKGLQSYIDRYAPEKAYVIRSEGETESRVVGKTDVVYIAPHQIKELRL